MENKRVMPDLYVINSNEEVKEAVDFAIESGVTTANFFENINYKLTIKQEDLTSYVKFTNYWFPRFSDYISFPLSEVDSIGVLLSPILWTDYNRSYVFKVLQERGIFYKRRFNGFVDTCIEDIVKEEIEFSKMNPVNAPWTARDISVVATALETIEGIDNAVLIEGVDFVFSCYTLGFPGMPISHILPLETFSYPNILHLETKNGAFNVFMGELIDINAVLMFLQSKGIFTQLRRYQPEDKKIILYPPRGKKLLYSPE